MESYENSLNICNEIYKLYSNLLNSYIADFYIENHWTKLPNSWQNDFKSLSVCDIQEIIDYSKSTTKLYPLSFLCLRNLIRNNTLCRKQIVLNAPTINKDFAKYMWKSVKMKKRHEIEVISQICYKTGIKTNCFNIVDVGAGLGHLSRMLSFRYGFNICTFEADSNLTKLASDLDEKFNEILKVKSINHCRRYKTVHVNKIIENDIHINDFLNLVKKTFQTNDNNFKFGIVGLHPCGNLGTTLLRLYKECENIVFINIVSCCYMKLDLNQLSNHPGFPLSRYCKNREFSLNYLSCEIACHAIENYIDNINSKQVEHLKVHAARAALEQLIANVEPRLRHCQLCSCKFDETCSFKEYCKKALRKYENIKFPDNFTEYEDNINETSLKVAVFYSLRLLLAPVVETIILIDRFKYVHENGGDCEILPVFNPNISPRNHVISACKI